jgi:hypothetical protein
MKFDPIGMGSPGGTSTKIICACELNGPGCGPLAWLDICRCRISGPGAGPWIP